MMVILEFPSNWASLSSDTIRWFDRTAYERPDVCLRLFPIDSLPRNEQVDHRTYQFALFIALVILERPTDSSSRLTPLQRLC